MSKVPSKCLSTLLAIKPCPWCGGTDIKIGQHVVSAWEHSAKCLSCRNHCYGCSIWIDGDHKKGRISGKVGNAIARKKWNTRHKT